jgi:hypothetical protein
MCSVDYKSCDGLSPYTICGVGIGGGLAIIAGLFIKKKWSEYLVKKDRAQVEDRLGKISCKIDNAEEKLKDELALVTSNTLSTENLTVIAKKIEDKPVQELIDSLSTLCKTIDDKKELGDYINKYPACDRLRTEAEYLYDQIDHDLQQLLILYNFFEQHKDYFVYSQAIHTLNKIYNRLAAEYELEIKALTDQQVSVNKKRYFASLKQIIIGKCTDVSTGYPYVNYMKKILFDIGEVQKTLAVLSNRNVNIVLGDTDTINPEKVLKLQELLETIKQELVCSDEYQNQHALYQIAENITKEGQRLVQTQEDKIKAIEQSNRVQEEMVQELKTAIMCQNFLKHY